MELRDVSCPCGCGKTITVASYKGRFGLTKREALICDLSVAGVKREQIAKLFKCQLGTVTQHLHSSYDKVGADRTLDLMLWAWKEANSIQGITTEPWIAWLRNTSRESRCKRIQNRRLVCL